MSTDVNITCVDKRELPTKHYAYVISVTKSDGHTYTICRRYRQFFNLHCKLLDNFPHEGGTFDEHSRTIPLLPGKIIFGRSHIRQVALERKPLLETYCKALISLPRHISQHTDVVKFFAVCENDITNKEEEESLVQSRDVTHISAPMHLDEYSVVEDFVKVEEKEISVQAGEVVELIQKRQSGWWFVKSKSGTRGWISSEYLEKVEPQYVAPKLSKQPPPRPPPPWICDSPPRRPSLRRQVPNIASKPVLQSHNAVIKSETPMSSVHALRRNFETMTSGPHVATNR